MLFIIALPVHYGELSPPATNFEFRLAPVRPEATLGIDEAMEFLQGRLQLRILISGTYKVQ